MKLQISFKFYDLPLKDPFTISRYTVTTQKTVVVSVSDGQFTGYGEATVNPYYGSTVEKLSGSLMSVGSVVESGCGLHPEELWIKLEPLLKDDYFSLCAIDNAYWDYFARKQGVAIRSLFTDKTTAPLTSYTIGIASVEEMKLKIQRMPWPLYKIKLGTPDDIAIVEQLRTVTDAAFRIDANGAWTADQAIDNSKILQHLNVEFIEQPLPAGDLEGMRKVFAESALPVIADESCQMLEDVAHCGNLFHGINIKLMKCGGLTPALKMISEARKLGLRVMAGCMTESTVGISSLVQIAPLLDYLDADGALLLREDVASGVSFDFGKVRYPDLPGSGVEMYTE